MRISIAFIDESYVLINHTLFLLIYKCVIKKK